MKKIFCLLNLYAAGLLILLTISPSKKAEALTPPTVTPVYYNGTCNNTDYFVQWFKSDEAKTINDGAFKYFIDSYYQYGYLLIPYIEGDSVQPTVSYNSDSRFLYLITNPKYKVNTNIMKTLESKRYIYSGIAQCIKDNLKINDFSKPYVYDLQQLGMPIYKSFYAEKLLNIGGVNTQCVWKKEISYSPYIEDKIIGCSYSISFIHNGMFISITYCDENDETAIIDSIKNLNLKKKF